MKIYLFLANKIVTLSLPEEVSGSFSFDENDIDSKLINIEARDNKWVLYSTKDSTIINNGAPVDSIEAIPNTFYIIRRDNKNYLIYITKISDSKIVTYKYDQTINLVIGNDNNCNLNYNCEYIKGPVAQISYKENNLVLDIGNNSIVYVNNKSVKKSNYPIKIGDTINIYGLKIIFLPTTILINSELNRLVVNEALSKLQKFDYPRQEEDKDIEIKDRDLYSKEEYYSKSPRIRRTIETKHIELSDPPQFGENQSLPLILTLGPMLTMSITSIISVVTIMAKLGSKETTLSSSWPTLLGAFAMLAAMFLWPVVTNRYNKKLQKKRKKEILEKYNKYLEEKKTELSNETKLQKDILIENLLSTEECLNIIKTRGLNFWDKRIDQDDFLKVRIGTGNELLNVDIAYPEKGFTIDEDELKKQVDKMKAEYRYIENVPIGYSFKENKVTAVMGSPEKSHAFINNMILQLLTFYTYEDLKIVVFTNEANEEYWDYIKYLNHNFDNNRNYRFFASTQESCKDVADYLNYVVNVRMNAPEEFPKPHYIIFIDDYNRIKRFDFLKNITEIDNNLGFSVVLLEERLSKLPSKCNNFISLGINNQGGILKNSYERQQQTVFYDEVNYNIDMMSITHLLSNIPIEFEEGLKQLPDAISFMEMERVGKVEQLNVLNRWNTNDPTSSLKAEIGVDEQGDLMYLDLHEKHHGPHGLIAGTTGSGKSEFLITYIISMCINFSPDDISFILIDYKGGGLALAFENQATGTYLPHLAGTITNLDKAEMDRTLVSIDSEVKRRQKMFNEARDILEESTMDIYKYQRFYKEGRLKEPIPHLFIICDEFAELKSQQPEFMDNLISVARIGRSLGVHLILATQKPSGVVNDQIWSNSRFKVCLKVQDEQDSKEMLKRPDAAYLKQAGRFFLQVGFDEYFALGQSGWCGAKYYPSEKIVKQVDKSINIIDDCGNYIKRIQAGNSIKIEAQGEQLGNVLKLIIEVAKQVGKKSKRLWLENIPEVIIVDNLEKKYNITHTPYIVEAVMGEYDAPQKQEQGIVKYNILEDGNTIVYGNDSIEKELFLNTLIYSASKNHTPEEINFYVLDFGSESLRIYNNLPHISGFATLSEENRINNLFDILEEEVTKRKKLFTDFGGSFDKYNQANNKKLPLLVVIINNYENMKDNFDSLIYEQVPEITRDSERYGIVFVLTAMESGGVKTSIQQNFKNFYAFKLKDNYDYQMIFNKKRDVMPRDIIGRGILLNDGELNEFQVAYPSEKENMDAFIKEYTEKEKQKYNGYQKYLPLPTVPDKLRIDDVIGNLTDLTSVPVGVSTTNVKLKYIDFISNIGQIISGTKIETTVPFVSSLIELVSNIKGISLMVFDHQQALKINKEKIKNYYTNSFETIIPEITKYISSLISSNSNQQGLIIINGLDSFVKQVNNIELIEELTNKITEYEKIGIIIVEANNKYKTYYTDRWIRNIIQAGNGIWIGNDVSKQSAISCTTNRAMALPIKNDMGYIIEDNNPELSKLLDFYSEE